MRPQQADGLFYQELVEICIFFIKLFAPMGKIIRGKDPWNRYALTLQNMCIKRVGDTFWSVLFLPEVVI